MEVRELHKTFRIPTERVHRLKERVLHPMRSTKFNELHVLNNVSFEVERGEFFGIVGVNGSGKSTLLKLLSSIYRADSGSIRAAGTVTPFIELGVGFNPELTAHDNVLLNGVMMGLSPKEARERYDAVMDYAGLREFGELQLKNYSSGMQVRLAFSVMLQVESDILLIDEVLAVGDHAFQEKCIDSLTKVHASGRTIVFVTHAMPMVERFCDRAMLLHHGEVKKIGEPVGVTSGYLDVARSEDALWTAQSVVAEQPGAGQLPADVTRLELADAEGRSGSEIDVQETFEIDAEVVLREPLERAWVHVEIENSGGTRVFGAGTPWIEDGARLEAGERLRVSATIENRLGPGEYTLTCTMAVTDPASSGTLTVSNPRSMQILVAGRRQDYEGMLSLRHELSVERRSAGEPLSR